jgi:hypothetical protein
MSPERVVQAAVKEYNADFTTRAWVAIAMGVLTSLGVYALILGISFAFFCLRTSWWFVIGTAIFGTFFGVSWWACSRGAQDPSDGIRPVDNDDAGAMALAWGVTGFALSPRHTVAGFAGVLMHGPASIIEGRSMLAARLPADGTTRGAAATLLMAMNGPNGKAKPGSGVGIAALVLVRTGLAKPQSRTEPGTLVPTIKAREALAMP